MRKSMAEGLTPKTRLTLQALQLLEQRGFKFVQVRGLTIDKHYDYVEPNFLMLVPMKELPIDESKKDIYEPIESALLKQWANETNSSTEVFISENS
jgi:hypothetical protein